MNSEKSLPFRSCPDGYSGHYTIAAQDTLAFLAGLFSVAEEDLIHANPQISSAGLEAGTVIHIPGLIPFPAGINFTLLNSEMPFASGGGAFVHISPEGGQSVSVIATLPTPSYFGSFDLYLAEVHISASNIFEGQLFATPDDPPSWAARIDLPFLTSLSPESEIFIRPFNSLSGISGDNILHINLADLPPMACENTEVLSITSEYDTNENKSDEYIVPVNENSDHDSDEEVFDEIDVLEVRQENRETAEEDLGPEEKRSDEIIDPPDDNADNLADSSASTLDPAESEEYDNNLLQEKELSVNEDESAEKNHDRSDSAESQIEAETSSENAFNEEESDPLIESAETIVQEELLTGDAFSKEASGLETDDLLSDAELEPATDIVNSENDNTRSESVDPLTEEESDTLSADREEWSDAIDNPLSEEENELEISDSLPEEGLTEYSQSEETMAAELPEEMATNSKTETLEVTFDPQQIMREHSVYTKKSPRFNPYSSTLNHRRPFNMVLNGTVDAEQAIGIASIQLQPGQLNIAALKLPEPATLGQQYKYYKAWLVDAANSKTAAIEMKKVLNGVWAGQLSGSVLKSLDLIFITAEPNQNTKQPSGPEVLIGIIGS